MARICLKKKKGKGKMNHRFTPKAQNVLNRTLSLAGGMGHTYIGSEHLLLSLLSEEDSVAGRFLESHGLTEEKVRTAISDFAGVGGPVSVTPKDMTPRTKHIIEASAAVALRTGAGFIGTEHLLFATVTEKESVAFRLLGSLGIRPDEIAEELSAFFENTDAARKSLPRNRKYTSPLTSGSPLNLYGRDLTARAAEGKNDPLIGREEETERVIRILSRRTKNNPCLIGEPGVGKTAVAEGLAARIAEGNVPENLKNKCVILLDLSAMIAGAKYRGEFEDRLKSVLKEVEKNDRIILFIDEVHVIVGAGAAEGAVDAANILKPALARGELQMIGATTLREYRAHIEKDSALARRFQPVLIGEPNEEETVKILEGLKDRYEAHHKLKISDEAIRAAVRLSVRYMSDRFLPDKAIDLLDEAASALRVKRSTRPPAVGLAEKQLCALSEKKLSAIKAQDFERAAALRDEEAGLRLALEQTEKAWETQEANEEDTVEAEHVAEVVTRHTGIPLNTLTESEEAKLARLEEVLQKSVIGQEEAVSTVARAVRRSRLGLRNPKRPVGSFLFLGPTGVGKTALSRTLAEVLFGGEDALIRLDMSEYMERHSVSKLIGSPPGYIGYDEGGQLTERIRRRPYAVVLFDEIEKAHPDITNILLQVMEDGALTDSQGRRVDFSNAIIILTSNAGAREMEEARPLGFTADAASVAHRVTEAAMKNAFRPEFLNRLDEIVHFRTLSEEDLKKIASLMLSELAQRAAESGLTLIFEENLCELLVKESYQPSFGARPLRRTITRLVEDALSGELLSGRIRRDEPLYIGARDGTVVFRQKEKTTC